MIADQEGTEVNEAYIRYNGDATKVAYGRQRINILNQRFIGGVGWRQNEQTYDGLTIKTKLNDKFDFNYAYVFNVNRIFGENVPAGDHQHSTSLLDANYKLSSGVLSAYYFAIDNKTLATFSNDTFGVRYKGKYDALSLTLEFATQSAGDDNPNDYDADYSLLHASYQLGDFSVGGGIETLGGDTAGGQGFTTSLATLHGFQGWADVFLGTPVAGIEDSTLEGTYKFSGYKFKVVYHDFATDEGGVDLGTEIDWALSKKVNKNLSALLKYADFNSDNAAYASRRIVWLMLSYNLK